MKAIIKSELPAAVDDVWRILLKKETFLHITRGMLGFSGTDQWPARFQEGLEIETRLWFFHIIPGWLHRLKVIRVDHQNKILESRENGGFVSRWDHRIMLGELAGDHTRYADVLEIEAGAATWLVWSFVHLFYRYRQWRWRRLLERNFSY